MSTRNPSTQQDTESPPDSPRNAPADDADADVYVDPATGDPLVLDHTIERTVRVLYEHYELSTRELADACGISKATAARWVRRHGIEPRDNNGRDRQSHANPFTDEAGRQRLKRLHEDGLSPTEIAELPDVPIARDCVRRTLKDLDAEGFLTYTAYNGGHKPRESASRWHSGLNDYPVYEIGSKTDETGVVKMVEHKFIAVAEYGIDACCDSTAADEPDETQVHHGTFIKCDNRPGMLYPVDADVHQTWHGALKSTPHVFVDEGKLDPADAVAGSLVIDDPDDAPSEALRRAREAGAIPHEGIEIPVRADGTLSATDTEDRVVLPIDEDGQPTTIPQPTSEAAVEQTIQTLADAAAAAEVEDALAEIDADVDAEEPAMDSTSNAAD